MALCNKCPTHSWQVLNSILDAHLFKVFVLNMPSEMRPDDAYAYDGLEIL